MTKINKPCGRITDFFGTWTFEPTPDIRLENNTDIYSVSSQEKVGTIFKSYGLWKFEPVRGYHLKDDTDVCIIN